MLRITRLDRHRGNPLAYLRATEYYRGKNGEEHSTSRWIGNGASTLGLAGYVAERDQEALADGFAPDPNSKDGRGEALCRNAGDMGQEVVRRDRKGNARLNPDGSEQTYWKGGHRIGFDCTFSADKSVSLLFAAADDAERERIVAAHRAAVDRVFKVMEDTIETRRGHAGAEVIGVQGLVASGFTHFGNRELEPQLHEHVLVYGVAQGADGKWGTFDAHELYSHQQMFGALYRAELAQELQRLGYGIEQRRDRDADGRETGEVYFGVAGISRELCDAYSTRHRQIVEYVREHGGHTTDASLATRAEKDEPPFEKLSDAWRQSLDQHREHDPSMFRDTRELLGRESRGEPRSDRDILAALHESEAVWTKHDLIAQLAREHVGRMGTTEIMAEADAFLARNDLVHIRPELEAPKERGEEQVDESKKARRFTEERYAARWWIDGLEQNMLNSAREMRNDENAKTAPERTDKAIAGFEQDRGYSLSEEQRRAVHHLADSGAIAILEGRAGTGKTTTTDALVRALRDDGREVIGCSTSWDAARKLEAEAGIQSYSSAALLHRLDSGRIKLDDRSVVIMDEAGMAGTADLARLVDHVHRAEAKLVLEGDAQQLQAVDAGAGFRMLGDQVGRAELTEIRRQRDGYDRGTVEAFYAANGTKQTEPRSREAQQEQGAEILDRLEARGQVQRSDTKQQATADLVGDWAASEKPTRDKIVIAATRDDVQTLNTALRANLQERGEVAREGVKVDVVDGARKAEIEIATGDRIRFGRRDNDLGVVNGTVAVVESVSHDKQGRVQIDARIDSDIATEHGRQIRLDPTRMRHFGYAYAGTVHKGQGQTKEECYHLAHAGMTDRHLSLVAASRARGAYTMYGAQGDLETIEERLGMDRMRSNALDAGRSREQAPQREQVQEQAREAAAIIRERHERELAQSV